MNDPWTREQDQAAAHALAAVMAESGNALDAARAAHAAAEGLVREERQAAEAASCGHLVPGRWGGTQWPCQLRLAHAGDHRPDDAAQHLTQHPSEMTRDRLVFEMATGHRAARDARDLIADRSAAAERSAQEAAIWRQRAETLAALRARTKAPARGRSRAEREVVAWAEAQVDPADEVGAA